MQLNALAVLMHETVVHCQKKFVNPISGTCPSFMLSLRVYSYESVIGYYLPILNFWGLAEYDHLVYGDGALALPFPHGDTYAWLTDAPEETLVPSELLLRKHEGWKAIVGGIRAGQVFFVRSLEDYHRLALDEKITSGGTRRSVELVWAKMKRTWSEVTLLHVPSECPFCAGNLNNPIAQGEFIVFDNRFTPHPWHKVIIPNQALLERCPPDSVTGLLPLPVFSEILELITHLFKERRFSDKPVLCGMHTGVYGGQNLPHPHFHVHQV